MQPICDDRRLNFSKEHPWVTKNGTDNLLPAEENTADLVEPPSETEVNHAITAKMRNLIVLVCLNAQFTCSQALTPSR